MDDGQARGTLKCLSCEPPDCVNPTVCTEAVICWKSINRDSIGVVRTARGCIQNKESVSFFCNLHRHANPSKQARNRSSTNYKFQVAYQTECCSGKDFCNDGPFPKLPSEISEEELSSSNDPDASGKQLTYIFMSSGLGLLLILVAVAAVFVVKYCRQKRRRKKRERKEHEARDLELDHCEAMGREHLQTQDAGDIVYCIR